LIYTGIGSRETPEQTLSLFQTIGRELAQRRHLLRSGFADGADMAFFKGTDSIPDARMEMYIPWPGFNRAPLYDERFIVPAWTPALVQLAAAHHPAWDRCSQGAQKLHARNGCQILGEDLSTPADLVICWTVGGKGTGGTGQAIRIARSRGIRIFDFGDPALELDQLVQFVRTAESHPR
jgi:hypothetical protein